MPRKRDLLPYRYRHQPYPTVPVIAPRRQVLRVNDGNHFDFSPLHRELGVSRILLVHGTFVGDDPFGIADVMRSLGETVPWVALQANRIGNVIRERMRPMVNSMAEDLSNYSPEFLDRFQQLTGPSTKVEFLEPTWSSQNDHLARADLAMRMIAWLIERVSGADDRVLLWGHSHAGNGFALLSNLLANERLFVDRFFESAGQPSSEHWSVVQRELAEAPSPHPIARQVMVATFGTPVRYGWDMTGIRSLAHVLFDRNGSSVNKSTAANSASGADGTQMGQGDVGSDTILMPVQTQTHPLFPPYSFNDLLTARYGDGVQTFAVAGTDLSAPASVAANRQMNDLLEASLIEQTLQSKDFPFDVRYIQPNWLRDLCIRWKTGTRCHTDGINLLVDYEPSGITRLGMPLEQCVLGHGVATTIPWLRTHLKLVTETLLSLA